MRRTWAAGTTIVALLAGAAFAFASAAPGMTRDSLVEASIPPPPPVAHPPVRVFVEKSPGRAGRVTYHYVVINNGPSPVTALRVGFDEKSGASELKSGPLGWVPDETPATSFTSPEGWSFRVVRTEEDSLLFVTWEIDSDDRAIWTGMRLGGFAVTVAGEDTSYERGHWNTITSGAEAQWSDRLEHALGALASPRAADSSARGLPRRWLATGAPDDSTVSARYDLRTGRVRVEYEMEEAGAAEVAILDRDDRVLKTIFHGDAHVAKNFATWDGRDTQGHAVAPGTYSVRVVSAEGERYARVFWMR